jgi:biotin transport system substrate-specific component
VPITAQTLGVMLAGLILGPKLGAMAMALFIGLVLMGLPLLSGGRGGLGVLAGPTVGFFLVWPLAAALTGWVAQQLQRFPVTISSGIAAALGGIGVVYAGGILGLHWVAQLSLSQASLAVLVFLPGDALKVVLAAVLSSAVFRALPHQFRSRQ